MRHIISNKIKTPDGTVIESKHRYGFVCHIDDITGLEYCVDGGTSCLRRLGGLDYEELSCYSDALFEVVRSEFKWGSYGKDGNEPLHHIALKDMTTEHIKAVLVTQTHIPDWIYSLFIEELSIREDY